VNDDAFWTELSLRVKPEASEAVAELLQDLTGNGVTIEPPIEALGPDEGYVLDLEAPLRIIAYLRGAVSDEQRGEIERALAQAGLDASLEGSMSLNTIREEDWAEAWKAHYDIESVGRVVVRPAWREYSASVDETVISLDPGMAFGTGQHPTTRMCLLALQELMQPGDYVLDLGSGSGILAIAAIALGAKSALATDTEEQAVAATQSNSALNEMQSKIEVRPGSIEAVGGDGPFDCIMANINAAAVTALAGAMAQQLKPGAWLAAGGVIAEREQAPREALQAAGLVIERTLSEGDWRTFIARRPSDRD
jgi:ribosomal protein L11 methyltransferase